MSVVKAEILQSLHSFRMTKKNVNDMKNCKVVKAEILHFVQNDELRHPRASDSEQRIS